jgi:DUF971 family protein
VATTYHGLCENKSVSHEGIKFGKRDELAGQEKVQYSPAAITPAKVRVHLKEGTGLEIDWKDGHHSAFPFAFLRNACPCAHCNEEREKQGRSPGQPEKPKPGLLPMYKEPARPIEVTPVGRYAISFHWNDGHQHGIYSWEYLRSLGDILIAKRH